MPTLYDLEFAVPFFTESREEYFKVDVSYDLSLFTWGEPDEKIARLAEECDGRVTDSGTGFGRRDVGCEFPSLLQAFAFVDACGNGPGVRINITYYNHAYRMPYDRIPILWLTS